jgi:hypothetical protein
MRQSPVNLEASLLSVGSGQHSVGSGQHSVGSGQVNESNVRFAVHGRWVPGTHRVVLERQDDSGSLEVHHNRVHQLFGRGAMDPLYLTGKSRFDCTPEEWVALNG